MTSLPQLLLDALLLAGALVVFLRRRPPKGTQQPVAEWTVTTTAAKDAQYVASVYDWEPKLDLNHTILVRITRGHSVVVIAKIDALADDFEDQIATAQAKAAEKAAALNAYVGSAA